MNTTYKTLSLLLLAIAMVPKPMALAETANPQVFDEDFLTSYSGSGGLAPEWVTPEKGGWTILDQGLTRKSSELDQILLCKAVTLSDHYVVSADVRVDSRDNAHFAGVAFNIQDEANYYVFRIAISKNENRGCYQVLKRKGGEWEAWQGPSFSNVEGLNSSKVFYKLIVESKGDGRYKFTIMDGGETLLEMDDEVSVRSDPYTGGNAGLYMGTAGCTIANFHVETTLGAQDKSKP